jgi:peptide/nickel transport system permease protein
MTMATPAAAAPGSAPPVDTSELRRARRETFRVLLRSKTFLTGLAVVGFWVVCAIFGNQIAPQDPLKENLLETLKVPSEAHWFGTDDLGRDVFARVIVGSRDIIVVCLLATLLGTAAGTALGLIMGYFRGLVDETLSRIAEAFFALPIVIVALLALTALGPSNWTVILVIGLVFTPLIARTVRSAVLSERELEYVSAALLRGERAPYIMFVEIFPNILPPVIVEFTVRLGYAIFAVATLSFLGFGIQPPAPDWGLQIAQGYVYLPGDLWWPSLFPALAIATLVVGVNLLADGIQGVFER